MITQLPLLPTPAVNDMGASYTPEAFDAWVARMRERHGGNGHGASLSVEARRHSPRSSPYGPAIARWEAITGHPAPPPTEPAPAGGRRLNAAFAEWMMGLPPGWVTQTPGVSRTQALRMVGNGVVPLQAAAALRRLASWITTY